MCFTWEVREGQSELVTLEQRLRLHGGSPGKASVGLRSSETLEASGRSLGFIPNMLRHRWRVLSQGYMASRRQRSVQTQGCVSPKPAFSPCCHTKLLPRGWPSRCWKPRSNFLFWSPWPCGTCALYILRQNPFLLGAPVLNIPIYYDSEYRVIVLMHSFAKMAPRSSHVSLLCRGEAWSPLDWPCDWLWSMQ